MTGPQAAPPVDATDNRLMLNALMHRTAAGDATAFEQLYRLTMPRVSALCRRIILDAHEADDISQDVMAEIWAKADRFDESRGSAIGWLLAITHRAVDRVRSLGAARRRDSQYVTGDFAPSVDDTAVDLLAADEHTAASSAVGRLSHLRRQALTYAY